MIFNFNWLRPKKKTYFHQISLDCIEKLVECLNSLSNGKIDIDTSIKMEAEILSNEIDDPEFYKFVIENFGNLFSYIANGEINIRIHRDVTGEMWFVVG